MKAFILNNNPVSNSRILTIVYDKKQGLYIFIHQISGGIKNEK
jgi:hypothetical protein